MKVALLHLFGSTRAQLAAHLRDGGLDVHAVSNAEDLLTLIASGAAGVVVTDLRLPGVHEGMELLSQCHAMDPQLTVIALSDQEDTATAVEAVHRGARDVLAPDKLPRLATACRQAIRSRELTLQTRAAESLHDGELAPVRRGIVPIHEVLRGNHPAVGKLRQALLRLSRVDTDVLVKAETGCGKEVVARCLHDYGPRADKRFVAINCGAIPENIFESELFGHEAGAFTGAGKQRIGKIEHAKDGTLFLDEIEAMPLALQAKVLRVIQEREIERLGNNKPIQVNFRVVAATKVSLEDLAKKGEFRPDLFYRLNVASLKIPALRDRLGDILGLFQIFLQQASLRFQMPVPSLTPDQHQALLASRWPGNVRELKACAERMILGLPIFVDGEPTASAPRSFDESVAMIERSLLEEALRRHGGSVKAACAELSLTPATMYRKLKALAVDPSAYKDPAADPAG